jgi:tetratricopeptide (TPR) repeat protein
MAPDREHLLDVVDSLSRRIRTAVLSRAQLESDMDRPLGDITSHSGQAVERFFQAEELTYLGYVDRAVHLYDEAIRLDPSFYRALRARALVVGGDMNRLRLDTGSTARLTEYERLLGAMDEAVVQYRWDEVIKLSEHMLSRSRKNDGSGRIPSLSSEFGNP